MIADMSSHPILVAQMSPLFALIALVVFAGALIFVIGLIARRRRLIALGAPSVLLIAGWFILPVSPPNPERAFDRVFGAENRPAASNITTTATSRFDGYFISFVMPNREFYSRLREPFDHVEFTNFHLLRGDKLPPGWPRDVANAKSSLVKETDHHEVLLIYDQQSATAYASVRYQGW
jgi:hypothetical protein